MGDSLPASEHSHPIYSTQVFQANRVHRWDDQHVSGIHWLNIHERRCAFISIDE
jgi:hypothetical protein